MCYRQSYWLGMPCFSYRGTVIPPVSYCVSDECSFWDEIILLSGQGEALSEARDEMRGTVIKAILDPKTKLREQTQRRILCCDKLEVLPDHTREFSEQTEELFGKFSQVLKKQ